MPMTDPACIPMFPEPSHKHLLHIQCQSTIECNSLEGDCHEVQSGMMPLQHAALAAPTIRCKPGKPSIVCHDNSNGQRAESKALALQGCAKDAVSGYRESLIWVCLNHFWGLKVALLQTFKVQATRFVHLRSMCTLLPLKALAT